MCPGRIAGLGWTVNFPFADDRLRGAGNRYSVLWVKNGFRRCAVLQQCALSGNGRDSVS